MVGLFCVLISFGFGQDGAPLLSNYSESREIENQSWAVCQDDNNLMLFANRRGILTFDGHVWDFIRIPTIPYSLKYNSKERRVFIGGEDNYGYLVRDEKGFNSYFSLSGDTADVGMITKIIFNDSTVYFYSDKTISRHNLRTGKLELRLSQKSNFPFTGMFVTPRNTFINVYSRGLYRLDSDTLFPIVTGYLLTDKEVLFCLPYNETLVLLGMGDGTLSLFDGIKFSDFRINDDGYLQQNILSEGIRISDTLYAFSTLDGGAIVVGKNSRRLLHFINYSNGLPDDEIFAMGIDNSNGLWLLHQYGLTRAELVLPVGNFSIYSGIKGNLINSLWHNGELYVSTSEGLFYLSEVKNYNSEVVFVRNSKASVPASLPPQDTVYVQSATEVQKTRKSILSRIFGRRNIEHQNEETEGREQFMANEQALTPEPVEPAYIRKTVNRLQSVSYQYKKVEGLDEKCKQMISTDDGILAATNKGLFIISEHSAKPLVNDRYINYISGKSTGDRYFIASADGYFYVTMNEGKWKVVYPDKNFMQPLYSVVSVDNNLLWAGTDNAVLKISLGDKPVYQNYSGDNLFPERYNVDFVNDTLFVFSETSVSYIDKSSGSLKVYNRVLPGTGMPAEFVLSQPSDPWIRTGEEWICLNQEANIDFNDRSLLKIFDDIVSIYTDENSLWVINGNNQLFRISRNKFKPVMAGLELYIKSITNEDGTYFRHTDIVFDGGDNTIYFDIVAPSYLKENSTRYQYTIDGVMSDWSKWSTSSTISLMMQPGNYTLRVRAKDIWGNITEAKTLEFTIKTPFVRTTLFYILMVILALIVFIVIVRFRERRLQRVKRILEEKVVERTAEIAAQKEEITSSIEYASRIQMAMLPINEHFRDSFSEHFIIFNPRDIVSGDFYWIGEDDNHIYFTVADCTGHGVPGAFMSTLGISTLNEIITNRKDLHANTVLNLLREKIKTSLHQTGKEGEATDGMDLAFCILHKRSGKLEYAGAFNSLFIFQSGELKEYKADRMPIGIFISEKESFTNYEINVSKGDIIYLFTDGFTDQFGGPDGSKYKKANLKKLLTGICLKPMDEQKKLIAEDFALWKGKTDQIDDVTFIGIKI